MVAESEIVAHAPKGYSPLAMDVKLKIKNLYLYQGATYAQIAEATGATDQAIRNLIHKSGWSVERKAQLQRLEKTHDASALSESLASAEAIGSQCTELTLTSLNRTREALQSRDPDAARNFQSWTAGVRNLVSAIKTLQAGGAADNGNTQINLFMIRAGDAMGEVKQVTEIEPKQG